MFIFQIAEKALIDLLMRFIYRIIFVKKISVKKLKNPMFKLIKNNIKKRLNLLKKKLFWHF